MARPPRRLLSREQIVAAAIELVDADGRDEFSTRKLAAALGVRGPSLYNYFANKDEILRSVANRIAEEVDLSMLGRDHWADALQLWARSLQAVLQRHPNIVPLLVPWPDREPAVLQMTHAILGALVDAGWPVQRAAKIEALMRNYITGSALGSFALGFPADPHLHEDRYPCLQQAHQLIEHQWEIDEGAFELGLSALLEGLEREFERTDGGGRVDNECRHCTHRPDIAPRSDSTAAAIHRRALG